METKKSSTVSKVLHNVGQFSTQHGPMFKHEIRFENGDTGIYNSKSDTCTKFKEGEKATYTIEPNGNYPAKIKPVQEEQSNGKEPINTQTAIMRQCAIKCSCQLHSQSMVANDIIKVMDDAEKIYQWMLK